MRISPGDFSRDRRGPVPAEMCAVRGLRELAASLAAALCADYNLAHAGHTGQPAEILNTPESLMPAWYARTDRAV